MFAYSGGKKKVVQERAIIAEEGVTIARNNYITGRRNADDCYQRGRNLIKSVIGTAKLQRNVIIIH